MARCAGKHTRTDRLECVRPFDAASIERRQHVLDAHIADARIGCDFDKRNEGEGAFMQARVRDAQAGLVHRLVAIGQHVDIERAGPPQFAAIAAAILLDGKAEVQQRARSQRGAAPLAARATKSLPPPP